MLRSGGHEGDATGASGDPGGTAGETWQRAAATDAGRAGPADARGLGTRAACCSSSPLWRSRFSHPRARRAPTRSPKSRSSRRTQTVEAGAPASFTSTATATPTPTVQWELSTNGAATWNPIPGATSTTYSIAKTVASENGYEFRAVFKNGAGPVASKPATLTVTEKPFVTQQPADAFAGEGKEASFDLARLRARRRRRSSGWSPPTAGPPTKRSPAPPPTR